MAMVLIIGASRGIGLETVKAALEAGHSVRALARSAGRIPIDRPKLEKMAGDALENGHSEARAERSRRRHPVARRLNFCCSAIAALVRSPCRY